MNILYRSHVLLLAAAALMVGCASPKKIEPTKPLAAGDRVGLIVYASPNPAQHHKGSYVGANFQRAYTAFDWRLKEGIFETVSEKLAAKGFKVVDLNASGLSVFDVKNLIGVDEDTGDWQPMAGKEAIVGKLKNELNLKAVVSIGEEPIPLPINPNRIAAASGVISVTQWPLSASFEPLAPLWWHVYMLDPLEELGTVNPGSRGYPGYKNNPAFGMTPGGWHNGVEVKNYESITGEEFQQFRAIILQSVGEKAEHLSKEISAQSSRAP